MEDKIFEEKTQVSGTNDYSIQSKYSLVRKGYINDQYLKHFVVNTNVSRSPIINWGYFVRHCAMQFGLDWIKKLSDKSQQCSKIFNNILVSFGAGFDTLALRNRQLPFIELDYTSVCIRKSKIMLQNKLFTKRITTNIIGHHDPEEYSFFPDRKSGIIFATSSFILIGADLRNTTELKNILLESQPFLISMIKNFYSFLLPNDELSDKYSYRFVFLNECALCYIQESQGTSALLTVKSFFENISEIGKNCRFVYLSYEMYENSLLKNGYVEFMKAHFREIGAEILHFPVKENIHKRCKILDLKHCEIFSARKIKDCFEFKKSTFREKFQLEPFDEWEDLDTVAMCYTLTIAHNENECVYEEGENRKFSLKNHEKRNGRNSFELSVFDHSSVFFNNSVIIFGGFGIEPQKNILNNNSENNKINKRRYGHKRFQNLIQLKLDESQNKIVMTEVIQARSKEDFINRQHCKAQFLCTNYDSSSKFLLSGGRCSPRTIQTNSIVEIFHDLDKQEFILDYNSGFSRNSIRAFRHVFSSIENGSENQNVFIQYGGFEEHSNEEYSLKNKLWFYHSEIDQWNISDMHFEEDFTRRHSIAAAPFSKSRGVISHGGLNLNSSKFYKNFDIIDSRESQIHHFQIPDLEPRYGHQIIQDANSESKFWIVGGIGKNSIENNAIQIDLKSQKIVDTLHLQCINQTFLLQKFTIHSLLKSCDKKSWITIGGGGNCFSFGTSFNSSLFF